MTSTHRLYAIGLAYATLRLSPVSPIVSPASCEWRLQAYNRPLDNETKRVMHKLETAIWTTSPPTPSPIYRVVCTIWPYWLGRGQVHSLHPKKFPSFCIPPYSPIQPPKRPYSPLLPLHGELPLQKNRQDKNRECAF